MFQRDSIDIPCSNKAIYKISIPVKTQYLRMALPVAVNSSYTFVIRCTCHETKRDSVNKQILISFSIIDFNNIEIIISFNYALVQKFFGWRKSIVQTQEYT